MDITPDLFLDVLSLTIYRGTERRPSDVGRIIELFTEDREDGSLASVEILEFYVELIELLYHDQVDFSNAADISVFMQKFSQSPAVKDNPKILDNIKSIIETRETVLPRRVAQLERKLDEFVVWRDGNKGLREMFAASQKAAGTSDPIQKDTLLNTVLERARSVVTTYENRTRGADETIEFLDMSDRKSIMASLRKYNEKRETNVLNLGLQHENTMYGSNGGVCPGEFIAYAASSFHYKSGKLMDIARQIPTYNKPPETATKPCAIVFTSLENEVFENLIAWYKAMYYNMYMEEPPADHTPEMIAEYVCEFFEARGFKLLVYRKMGETFGVEEFVAMHEELRKTYHICASILDYITLMKLPECGANDAKKYQIVANRIGNYGNHTSIPIITGLQLSGEAEMLRNSGQTNRVKSYSPGYLADCKGFMKELDVLFFLECEVNQITGVKYLTEAKYKHKYQMGIPDEHKYGAWRFQPFGIIDDFGKEDTSVPNIYSDESGSTTTAAIF